MSAVYQGRNIFADFAANSTGELDLFVMFHGQGAEPGPSPARRALGGEPITNLFHVRNWISISARLPDLGALLNGNPKSVS